MGKRFKKDLKYDLKKDLIKYIDNYDTNPNSWGSIYNILKQIEEDHGISMVRSIIDELEIDGMRKIFKC